MTTQLYRWTTLSATLAALGLALAGCPPTGGPDADADAGGATDAVDTDDLADTEDLVDTDGSDGTADSGEDTMDANDVSEDGGDTGDGNGDGPVLAVSASDFGNMQTRVQTVTDFSTGTVVVDKTYSATDIVLDNDGATLFVLNRSSNEIVEFTASADASLTEQGTYTMPSNGENPQDIELVPGSDRAFVSSYKSTDAFEFDGSRSVANRIDVGQFGSGGGANDQSPEAADVVVENGYAYFVLQRLDRGDMFAAKDNSVLAGWDIGDESFVDFDTSTSETDALDLQGKNAFTGVRQKPDGTWTVGLVADSQSIGGEIVQLNRESDGRLSVGSTIATETELDGNLRDYVWTGNDTGVAALAKAGNVKYVTFDVSGGSVQTSEMRSYTGFTAELCMTPDRSEVWIADKPMSASETSFVGYDPASGSKLSKSGPSVTGGAPSCTFLSVSN